MLELHAGQTEEKIIVTLRELQTLTEPYFLFRFVHVITKNIVNVIRFSGDDESEYPDRYNQFSIDTTTAFLNEPRGEWHYWAYEQTSSSNTDPLMTTTLLENGKLYLVPATEFEFEQYNEPVTFKTYNG